MGVIDAKASAAGLVWVGVGSAPPRPIWHVWHEGAIWAVVGGAEQPNVLDESTSQVQIKLPSKGSAEVVGEVNATVEAVDPSDDRWLDAAAALAAKRLNSADPRELVQRWQVGEEQLVRFAPTSDVRTELGDDPHRAVAYPSAATTRGRGPFHLTDRSKRTPRSLN